jgi:hypothetical protein
LDRARGDADALIRISWDKRRSVRWLVLSTQCDVIYATRAYLETSAERPAAGAARPAKTPAVEADLETPPAKAEPKPAGPRVERPALERGLPLAAAGGNVDAIPGFDGHVWGDGLWLGLGEAEVRPTVQLRAPQSSRGIVEHLAFDEIQDGFRDGRFVEVRMRVDGDAVAAFTPVIGAPTTSDDSGATWTGRGVEVVVKGRNVRIRQLD